MTVRHPDISLYPRTFTDGPQHDWRAMLESAQAMDIAGIDRVVVSDHVVFGENLEAYADPSVGGAAGGRQPTGPDGSWLVPIVVLTAIAATPQIRMERRYCWLHSDEPGCQCVPRHRAVIPLESNIRDQTFSGEWQGGHPVVVRGLEVPYAAA